MSRTMLMRRLRLVKAGVYPAERLRSQIHFYLDNGYCSGNYKVMLQAGLLALELIVSKKW